MRFIAGVFTTVLLVQAAAAMQAATLFPAPLHLTRSIEDPVTNETAIVEQYAQGNRLITIAGSRTTIADFASDELTEIDRASNTFSVTPFADLAKVTHPGTRQQKNANGNWSIRRKDNGESGGEIILVRRDGGRQIELAFHPSISVSREALEVLTGSAFPSAGQEEDSLLAAVSEIAKAGGDAPAYRLPVLQTTTDRIGSDEIRVRNAVTRVGNESPAPELIAIPSGARKITSSTIQLPRLLRELEQLPHQKSQD